MSKKWLAGVMAAVLLLNPLAVYAASSEANTVVIETVFNEFQNADMITEMLTNYSFVPDADVLGSWSAVGFADTPDAYIAGNGYALEEYYFNSITFADGGRFMAFYDTLEQPGKWTKGLIAYDKDTTVPAYEIRDVNGVPHLFIEWKSGDYTVLGYEPMFYVFVKSDQAAEFTVPAATNAEPAETDVVPAAAEIVPFSDVRNKALRADEYKAEDIYTYEYNAATIFEGAGDMDIAAAAMEAGKNPGFGVRGLHARGINGNGVNVAIIDQNLALTHPEYKDKLVAYYDTGTEQEGAGSMHGPAVASLLVGDESGTAPGANLYFAAAPSWTGDAQYYADALYWIIEENAKLPAYDKIRVVSVSAAPSGDGSPFELNNEAWDEAVAAAQAEGILVMDCRVDPITGFIAGGAYDPADPEDFSLFKFGYAPEYRYLKMDGYVYVPKDYRSYAEEYTPGQDTYTHAGAGGLSWAIPYAAGVLAMGWQVDYTLTPDEIVEILRETAYVHENGGKIIDPAAFVERVEELRDK